MKRLILVICLLTPLPTALWASTDGTDSATNTVVTRVASGVFSADGINTAGEYTDPDDVVDVAGSNFMEAKVFLHRTHDSVTGDEELRIYFSVHDIDSNSGDHIDFYFDRRHDHGNLTTTAPLAEDVRLRIGRTNCSSGSGSCSFERLVRDSATNLFIGAATGVTFTYAEVRTNSVGEWGGADPGFQDGWTGELVLTPADLQWGTFPPVIGFLVVAESQGSNGINAIDGIGGGGSPQASYPLNGGTVVDETEADDWANLKLRYPMDYALVLDFSGSMLATDTLTDNRWERAKRAADLFVTGLGLVNDDSCGGGSCFEDNIFASQYSWSCSDDTLSGDTTGAITGVSLGPMSIPAPPVGTNSFMAGNATDPPGNNCTPIRRGMDFSINDPAQLDYGSFTPGEKRERIVLLLSDGFHNQPSSHVPFDPGAVFATVIADDFTQMRTIALGPDGSAGTDLLSGIAVDFGGGSTVPAYNNPLTFPELMNAYLEVLQEPLTINMIDDGGTGNYTPGAPEQLVFIGVWDDAASAQTITVEEDPLGTPTAHVGTFSNTQIGYAAAVIDDPTPNSTWIFDDSALANPAAPPDQRYVLADLRIWARFLVAQKPYGAGDTISLGTRLLDTGLPLLNAEVTVEIAGPGEGLGNFLATRQSCEPRDPVLPRPEQGGRDDPLGAVSTTSLNAVGGTGDPIAGRQGLAASLFDECGLDGLDRLSLPGEQLHDDGTHGDANAGDGLYTLDFADTATEGTYTFRFHARGVTPDAVAYSRTRTASIYVGVEPDGDATDSVLIPGAISKNVQLGTFYVLPVDGIGNYLGPGFAHRMPVSISGGALVGDLLDLGNGIYSQGVQYAAGAEPDVTVGLPGGDSHEFSSRSLELIAPKLGLTVFDNGLGLDDGVSLGAELAWRFRPQTYLGVKIANTFTKSGGSSGDFVEALLGLRRDFSTQRVGSWTNYIKGSLGTVLIRDIGADDEAFAIKGSVGSTYRWSKNYGFRFETGVLQVGSLAGAGSSTNVQASASLVFYLD